MKVTWTARARTRLAELHDYIAQDSKPRALAMVEQILDRAEMLLVAPRSGARLTSFVDDEVRELLERPYRNYLPSIKHYRQRLVDRPEDF